MPFSVFAMMDSDIGVPDARRQTGRGMVSIDWKPFSTIIEAPC